MRSKDHLGPGRQKIDPNDQSSRQGLKKKKSTSRGVRSRMKRGKTTLEQTETEMAGPETGHRTKRGWKKGENKSSVEKELGRRRRQARRTTTPTAVSARKRDQGDGSPAPEKESQHRTGKENSCERTLKETYAGKGEEEEAQSPDEDGGAAD